MTEPAERPELPNQRLVRILAERHPELVAEALRELGYQVDEPEGGTPAPAATPWVAEDMPDVLDLTLELLRQSDAASIDLKLEIPGEMWMGEATDSDWGFHIGQQVLVNVHSRDKCDGYPCVLHNPSDHHMRDWPLLWRGDRRIMERRCPHGIGHPDPDDLAYQLRIGTDSGVHSCCGCCTRSITVADEPMPGHGIEGPESQSS